MIIKYKQCPYCGKTIEYKNKEPKSCQSPDCLRARNRDIYDSHRVKSICSKCGKEYMAAPEQNQSLCSNCARHIHNSEGFKEFEQIIICRKCGKPLGTIIKKRTNKRVPYLALKTCDKCKEENRKNQSIFLTLHNPRRGKSFKIQGLEKTFSSQFFNQLQGIDQKDFINDYCYELYSFPELKDKFKITDSFIYNIVDYLNLKRVINEQNQHKAKCYKEGTYIIEDGFEFQGFHWAPSKDPIINQKRIDTLKKKSEEKAKEIKEQKELKGSYLAEDIRSYLGKWRKSNLERVNYTCELCGVKDVPLQIHHKIPYRNIYYNCCSQIGVAPMNLIRKSSEYYQVKDLVVQYHLQHLEDLGLVVCKECHKKIDKIYNILQKGD